MSQRRTLILVAAIAIGALASFLVWNYVNNIQDTAYNDAARVPVYLVKAPIARGVSGTEAQPSIAKENIPRKFKPANAITDLSDISGKVAVNKLVPNQVVVTDMFVDASDPSAQQSFAERLTKIRGADQTAISIRVDKVRGVSNLIKPGDYVNVMVTDVTQLGAPELPKAPDGEKILFGHSARYVYQKVRVLAVDKSAVPQSGETTVTTPGTSGTQTAQASTPAGESSGLLTLIVPAKGAQYLASAPPENIYLTLVAADYKPVPQDAIDPAALIPAEDNRVLTPYGKDGAETTN